VLGYVDLILNFADQIGPLETREYLEKVHEESLHLERLISGMLRLFSIDAGREEWDRKDVSLTDLVAEALSRLKQAALEKALRIEVDLAEDLADSYGDREKAATLVHALADNAVKFNRPGGVLTIRGENRIVDGLAHVYLQIHNDGGAVPPEAAEDIFSPYTQLGDINTEKPQGVGIGLALCRAIAERMKGRIFLEPAGDEGTTFGLLLPTKESYGVMTDEEK
jgi:signal transduction histidine kinase